MENTFRRYLILSVLLYPVPELFQNAIQFLDFFIKRNPKSHYLFKEILAESDLELGVFDTFKRLYFGYEKFVGGFQNFLPQHSIMHEKEDLKISPMQTPVTATQISKGRKLLSELVESKQISPEGKAWLTFALDPFHDREIKGVCGIPDGNTGKSVVCSVVQETQIKKSSGMEGDNWSCRIATYPVAARCIMDPAKICQNLVVNQTVGPGLPIPAIAPVVIDQTPDGVDFPEVPLTGTGGNAQFLEIPSMFTKGPYKIGAMGVEVVNTTADIYKQGLVTCGRMNQTSCTTAAFTCFVNDNDNYTTLDMFPIRSVPINLAQMTLLTGNTAWHASEGAYSVVGLKSINDLGAMSKPVFPLVLSDDFEGGDLVTPAIISGASPHLTISAIPGLLPADPVVTHTVGFPGQVPSDASIIMFTGLSPQTTLTVRTRWMIERFPNDAESEIVVLAEPTAPYDPIALSIYSQVMQSIPAAVMFKENPQGEWWKQVLGTLADIVGSGLMMIPHPIAKVAGGAILTTNKVLNSDNSNIKQVVGKNGQLKPKARKKKAKGVPPKSGTIVVRNNKG